MNSNYSFIPALLHKFCRVLSSLLTKEESVEEPQIRICMHFLSRTVCRRLLLRCFIGFTEKLTIIESWRWLRWSRSDLRRLGLTGNSASSLQRHIDISHLLYSTLLLLKPFFLNEGNFAQTWNELFWDWQEALQRRDCLPFLERQTFFICSTPTPSSWNHSSWMKEILHKLPLQKNWHNV